MPRVLEDKVFTAVRAAKAAQVEYGELVTNATVGSFSDENEELVAFDSVFSVFKELPNKVHAQYASNIEGNPAFIDAVQDWLGFKDDLVEIIATPGGSGAMKTALRLADQDGNTVLIPDIFWGPYTIMVEDSHHAIKQYPMFNGDKFDVTSFKNMTSAVMDQEGAVTVVINDPAQNPTGYSMSDAEWDQVIHHLTELADEAKVNIILDVAYIDFTKTARESRTYFDRFKQLPENITVFIAFSMSKTFTSYGLRVGALMIIGKEQELLKSYATYVARSTWSNVNNAAQVLFAKVMQTPELRQAYLEERDEYADLLKQRSDLFLKEAKEVGLEHFPHVEGFFVTIKVPEELREAYDEALRKRYIYGISLVKGMRIALCSIPLRKVKGLAQKCKDALEEVKGL